MPDADGPHGLLGCPLAIDTASHCSSPAVLGRQALCRRIHQRTCLCNFTVSARLSSNITSSPGLLQRESSRLHLELWEGKMEALQQLGPRENIKHSMPNRVSPQIILTALFALFRQNKELKHYKASAALEPNRHPPPPAKLGHRSAILTQKANAGRMGYEHLSANPLPRGAGNIPRHTPVSSRTTPTTTAFCAFISKSFNSKK